MDIDFFGKANSGDPDPLFLTVATSQISTQTVTPPEAPVLTYSDLTVSGQQITVNFSAVTGAESYTIFKEINENGEPTPLDVNTSSTTEQPSSAPPYVHGFDIRQKI